MFVTIRLIVCFAGMVALGYGIHFMIYSSSDGFGHGFALGAFMQTLLMYIVWKLDPGAFNEGLPERFGSGKPKNAAKDW
jgi:hypothetical protein